MPDTTASPSETLRAAAAWLRDVGHVLAPIAPIAPFGSEVRRWPSVDTKELVAWLEENALAASYDVDDVNGHALAFAQSLPIPKEPTNG